MAKQNLGYQALQDISLAASEYINLLGIQYGSQRAIEINSIVHANYVAKRSLSAGLGTNVQFEVEKDQFISVEKKIRTDTEEDMKISKKTRNAYSKFLARSLSLAFKSQFHAKGNTKAGYFRNKPLRVGAFDGVGYGTGNLYRSIKVDLKGWSIGKFDGDVKIDRSSFVFYEGNNYKKYGKYVADGRGAGKPPPIHKLIEWIAAKQKNVTLNANVGRSYKARLKFAVKIINSKYGGTIPHKSGRQNSSFGTNSPRPAQIPSWNDWKNNNKIEADFITIHNRLSDRYVRMMLEDITGNITK